MAEKITTRILKGMFRGDQRMSLLIDFLASRERVNYIETIVASKTIQVTGLTLVTANWSLNGVTGFYEYDLENENIGASSIVEVIPANADIEAVKTAEILPETDSSEGGVKIYAVNAAETDISVTINITEKAE